jgi:hypothetical protein
MQWNQQMLGQNTDGFQGPNVHKRSHQSISKQIQGFDSSDDDCDSDCSHEHCDRATKYPSFPPVWGVNYSDTMLTAADQELMIEFQEEFDNGQKATLVCPVRGCLASERFRFQKQGSETTSGEMSTLEQQRAHRGLKLLEHAHDRMRNWDRSEAADEHRVLIHALRNCYTQCAMRDDTERARIQRSKKHFDTFNVHPPDTKKQRMFVTEFQN